MSGCQTCNNSCNSGNTCASCNSCESCNTNCNGTGCNSAQNFCATNQSVGSFSFGQDVGANDLFLTKANWNSIFSYINNAFSKGSSNLTNKAQSGNGVSSSGDGGDSNLPASDSNVFMTADMFNKVSAALGALGSSGPSFRATKDVTIIYGSYFSDLERYANNLQYKSSQCDDCNVACNVKCNTCLTCNVENCGSCNGACQTNSPSSCCSSCNTCQCSGQNNQNSAESE